MSLIRKNRISYLHEHSISPALHHFPNRHLNSQQTRKRSRLAQLRDLTKFQSIRNWFLVNLKNYCNTTSLHGFNYITNKSNTKAEKWFWIAIVLISIITSMVLVVVSYRWNRQTPTVTVIESSHFPTWNIPFPAVTICNFNKISKTKAMELTKTLKRPGNVSDEQLHHFFRSSIFSSFTAKPSDIEIRRFEQILELNNITLAQLTKMLTPDCLNMISYCLWRGKSRRCDSLFQRIITIDGECCSFNYFGTSTNNFPLEIANAVPKRPYRVSSCGFFSGLALLLNPMESDYFGTYFSSYGFRVFIHDAYNFPDENAESKIITSLRASFLRINPETTYATQDIRQLGLGVRNCLFGNERQLIALQRYSFVNCMTQCRIQRIFDRCGCLPPNLPHNSDRPLCSVKHMRCIIRNREIFTRGLSHLNDSVIKGTQAFPCGCLPDCESNKYPADITVARLSVDLTLNKSGNWNGNTALTILYSNLMTTQYRMELFQNWLSSLASFGGLLGLIMGFSIVTVFEFLYFCAFRPTFDHLNYRNQ